MAFRGTFGGFRPRDTSNKPRRPPSCFAHYARVLVGANRRPGRLMRCESKKPGGGEYWKVLLDSGEWVWPDPPLVLATPGTRVAVCEVGEGQFMTDQIGEGLLCPKHDGEMFGTPEDHALDAAAPRRPSGNTTRWKRGGRRRS